jgi:hypothetical protein
MKFLFSPSSVKKNDQNCFSSTHMRFATPKIVFL